MSPPYRDEEETKPLNESSSRANDVRDSIDSLSSSDTSIALERLNGDGTTARGRVKGFLGDRTVTKGDEEIGDEEDYYRPRPRPNDKRNKRLMWTLGALCFGGWLLALLLFISKQTYKHPSSLPYDPAATVSKGSGKAVTLDQVLSGQWNARKHKISWIAGANGEDGLLLERGIPGKDYLVVEDVRKDKPHTEFSPMQTLIKDPSFSVDGVEVEPKRRMAESEFEEDLGIVRETEELETFLHRFILDFRRRDANSGSSGSPKPKEKDPVGLLVSGV